MDWTWIGPAIVSPSFRVGFAGARRTFCQAPITPEDTADLIGIILATDTRSGMVASQLNNGARALLFLLGEKALEHFPTPQDIADKRNRLSIGHLREEIALTISQPNNIFNPAHANYVLDGGCAAYQDAN